MEKLIEIQYVTALKNVLENGIDSTDRTGTGTRRIQHQYFCIDMLEHGWPILKGKKIFPRNILVEAIWMLQGKTNTAFLKEHGCNYWDKWADKLGDLGPVYGKQMRSFNGVDQLQYMIDLMKNKPDSRQICMSLWNPSDLPNMKLPPCHLFYQVCVYNDGSDKVFDLHVTQRSADAFLGVPYDFMLFAYFAKVLEYMTGIRAYKIHYTCNDFHIYNNHVEQVNKYLNTVVADITGQAYEGDMRVNRIITCSNIFKTERFQKCLDNFALNHYNFGVDDLLDLMSNCVDFDVWDFSWYKPYGFIKADVAI